MEANILFLLYFFSSRKDLPDFEANSGHNRDQKEPGDDFFSTLLIVLRDSLYLI